MGKGEEGGEMEGEGKEGGKLHLRDQKRTTLSLLGNSSCYLVKNDNSLDS